MRYVTAGRILVADDEPSNIALVRRLTVGEGYELATAGDGEAALEQVRIQRPDVILLDVNMPRLDGFEVCRLLKADPLTRLIPVVLITGLGAVEDRVRGIEAGADDFLTKPFAAAELRARIRSLTRFKRYTDELDSAEAVILSLARTIEARDPYTGGHCERLASYASALGARLGLNEDDKIALRRGGFLHDVGKIGIPDAVLTKRGPLDAAERALMEQHPAIGDALCSELRLLDDVRPIVRHHHERLDGTGYPDRLSGDGIPLLAQIMSVVDAYDAMTTARPYRTALSCDVAFEQLRDDAAKGWKSATLVAQFTSMTQELDAMTHNNGQTSVLVVDDEMGIRDVLVRWLSAEGYDVRSAPDADAGLTAMTSAAADVVMCDIEMPGRDGLWMAAQILQRFPQTAIVLATGVDSVPPTTSLKAGIIEYLVKPFDRARVLQAMVRGVQWHRDAVVRPAQPLDREEKLANWIESA
jgi:putative two-component system response regulator